MDTRHYIFIAGFMLSVPIGTVLALSWQRMRDLFLFALVFGTLLTDHLDINFISRASYRGSTRGIEISFVDILAIVLLLTCILGQKSAGRRLFWPGSLGLFLVYFVYCCFSVSISDPKIFGVFELTKIPRGIIVFLAVAWTVRSKHEVNIIILGIVAAVYFGGALALEQRYIEGYNRISGPLAHYNIFSEYNCIAGAVLGVVAISNFPLFLRVIAGIGCLAAGVSVMLTISRMGAATYAVMIFVVGVYGMRSIFVDLLAGKLRISVTGVLCVLILGFGMVAIGVKASDTLLTRYLSRSLEEEYVTDNKGRGLYFRLASLAIQDHFFGVGLNNWSYIITRDYYPKLGLKSVPYIDTNASMEGLSRRESLHRVAPPAHNLGLLTLGELGYPGFIIFGLLWARWFQMGMVLLWLRSDYVMMRFGVGALFGICASFLHNFTEYGFRHTSIFFLVHILIGVLASLYYQHKAELRHQV